ncbi:MAG: XRE family transcriptional regulator [Sulfurimonas sp.]|nr:XRE family transcriptional regulator [Sulfurimonas sp.]
MLQLKNKFKQRRLFLKFTQAGLSVRSGVSLGSLKRFESSGQISLVLECLDDFTLLACTKTQTITSIDDLIKRGKIK